jgi:hypothetical protein
MEPKECFHGDRFGDCRVGAGHWLFQAATGDGEPVEVELRQRVFHHDAGEALH